MQLRNYIAEIAANYDRRDGLSSPTQVLIRSAGDEVSSYAPVGFITRGKAGSGNAAAIPWLDVASPVLARGAEMLAHVTDSLFAVQPSRRIAISNVEVAVMRVSHIDGPR
jgi:hypothetical protein